MWPSSAPAPAAARLLCALLSVSAALEHSDVRLVYVTHSSFFDYSCDQEPQPCGVSSLVDCQSREIQPLHLHLHRPQPRSPPALRARRLTVWFTSPTQAAHLLNNSEVRHLTLVHCGLAEGTPWPQPWPRPAPGGHFAVQHLERVTVVSGQQRPAAPSLDGNRARSSDSYPGSTGEGSGHLGTNHFHRAKQPHWDSRRDFRVQDVLLGRELGAAYYEQARLGVVHSSVLEPGALLKAYTVLTHIDSHGTLPFPELQLPKLPETSTIYVSFVY